MKKVFALLVIAGSLVACNNETDSSTTSTDSTTITTPSTVDTTTVQQPLDSTANAPLVDTTKQQEAPSH